MDYPGERYCGRTGCCGEGKVRSRCRVIIPTVISSRIPFGIPISLFTFIFRYFLSLEDQSLAIRLDRYMISWPIRHTFSYSLLISFSLWRRLMTQNLVVFCPHTSYHFLVLSASLFLRPFCFSFGGWGSCIHWQFPLLRYNSILLSTYVHYGPHFGWITPTYPVKFPSHPVFWWIPGETLSGEFPRVTPVESISAAGRMKFTRSKILQK